MGMWKLALTQGMVNRGRVSCVVLIRVHGGIEGWTNLHLHPSAVHFAQYITYAELILNYDEYWIFD